MEKSLKEYQNALIILKEQSKFETKGNKLVKIAVKTEDPQFKELLEGAITACHNHFKLGYSRSVKSPSLPNNRHEWVPFYKEKTAKLEKYINEVLSANKPQWQIIAEQEGWRKVEGK